MNRVLIAIGSNLGDRSHWVNRALHLMQFMSGNLHAVSRFYETAPIGAADRKFLNGACILETSHEPIELLRSLLRVESLLGRDRKMHWGNRTIDLDIILWQNADGQYLEMNSQFLKIPHPEALNRDFVMKPAAEIAGDWIFPNTKTTLEDFAARTSLHSDPGSQEDRYESLVQ